MNFSGTFTQPPTDVILSAPNVSLSERCIACSCLTHCSSVLASSFAAKNAHLSDTQKEITASNALIRAFQRKTLRVVGKQPITQKFRFYWKISQVVTRSAGCFGATVYSTGLNRMCREVLRLHRLQRSVRMRRPSQVSQGRACECRLCFRSESCRSM